MECVLIVLVGRNRSENTKKNRCLFLCSLRGRGMAEFLDPIRMFLN